MRIPKGFTLIELLLVISIVSAISTIIFASLYTARSKARDAFRVASVKQVQIALSMYHSENGSYPISSSSNWASNIPEFGGYDISGINGYIPNLAPGYINRLPTDPKQTISNGYVYKSNGSEYYFVAHDIAEGEIPNQFKSPSDPSSKDIAIYTPGFASSSIHEVVTPRLSTPSPSLIPGSYDYNTVLSFSADQGAVIHYTMNGTDPTVSSPVYSVPLLMPTNSATTFKAIAVKDGFIDSDIFSGLYVTLNMGCFLPGTLISTANGAIPIEQIVEGQDVLSFENDGEVKISSVTKLHMYTRDAYYIIKTESSEVKVTAEHPFYIGSSNFKEVKSLRVGDEIFTNSNMSIVPDKIISIEKIESRVQVYNLSVTSPNTYFANDYAVHNKPAAPS